MNTDFIDMRTRKGNLEYNKNLKLLARENRKNPTKAELLFWNMIVRKERLNYKFLRQKTIGNYIVDFYCAKLCLAIEIDGDYHDLKDNYDFERELFLKRRGVKIIHYENEQVFKYLENIFEDLKRVIADRKIELNSEIPRQPRLTPPLNKGD